MDILGRAVRNARGAVTRSTEWGDSSIPPNSALGTSFGVTSIVTEQAALTISAVMSCAKVLYGDLGILPFAAHTGDRYGSRRPTSVQPDIIRTPFGPDTTRRVGFGQIAVSIAMRGNAYLQVLARDADQFPTQLAVVHPDRVQVRYDVNGHKVFKINNAGPWLGGDDVKHILGLSMPGMVTGLDPITYQRVMLGLAGDVAQYGANFFRNGASPSGVISVKGPGTARNAREIKEAWEAGHAGVSNAHRPAVLFGGASWAPLSVTPENAQFLQTRQYSREEVCGWFGVPLQRIQAITGNASQGGGHGLDSIDQGYATHTLLPLTMAIEEIFDTFLPGDAATWTLFDFAGLLRASTVERAQVAAIHRLGGVRNRNEIRADEGWPPIAGPDGTDYNIPLNSNTHLPPIIEPGEEAPLAPVKDPADATAELDASTGVPAP